jgi:hypothetical protein
VALLDDLQCDNVCRRVRAVHKLGHRLHANFCAEPEVLDGLLGALLCDCAWEVRWTAAGSVLHQKACTDAGLLALYLSSQFDPHKEVRARAAKALSILTACRKPGWRHLHASAEVLLAQLQALGYTPGTADCRVQLVSVCSSCGIVPPVSPPPPTLPVLDTRRLRLGPVIPPGTQLEVLPATKPPGKQN